MLPRGCLHDVLFICAARYASERAVAFSVDEDEAHAMRRRGYATVIERLCAREYAHNEHSECAPRSAQAMRAPDMLHDTLPCRCYDACWHEATPCQQMLRLLLFDAAVMRQAGTTAYVAATNASTQRARSSQYAASRAAVDRLMPRSFEPLFSRFQPLAFDATLRAISRLPPSLPIVCCRRRAALLERDYSHVTRLMPRYAFRRECRCRLAPDVYVAAAIFCARRACYAYCYMLR